MFLLTLVCFQVNANSVGDANPSLAADKQQLIDLMSTDEDVARLVYNTTAVMLLKSSGADFSKQSEQVADGYNDLISSISESAKRVSTKFPEYAGLSYDAKQEVMQVVGHRLLDESNPAVPVAPEKRIAACTRAELIALAACVGVAGTWRLIKFFACMATATVINVEVDVATDGAAVEATYTEVQVETRLCAWIANNSLALSIAVAVTCANDFIVGTIACF